MLAKSRWAATLLLHKREIELLVELLNAHKTGGEWEMDLYVYLRSQFEKKWGPKGV